MFRRPSRENSAFVQQVLGHLEQVGVSWAPRPLGFDEGDELTAWIDGDTPTTGADLYLPYLVRHVRELHDRTVEMAAGYECVIHDDLQPRNVVVRERIPVGIIDWEQARPGRRLEDVAKLCWAFVEPTSMSDATEIGQAWRQIIDLYDLENRAELVPTVIASIGSCIDDIEREAAAGSSRHRVLADRGDHVGLRQILFWTQRNEATLERIFTDQ